MIPDSALQSLARQLGATRPIACLDMETTGTSVENDRAVELAVTIIFPDGRVVRKATLINPGMPIPPGTTKVHGITDADVKDAPTFKQIAKSLHEQIAGADLCGFNVRKFDVPLLANEMSRAGLVLNLDGVSIIDACEIFHRQEPRDLAAAIRFYGAEYSGEGHRAAGDVESTLGVLIAQLARYGGLLPGSVPDLGKWCLNRAPESLTDDGKIAWIDGAARFTFGKQAGVALNACEQSYLRWVLTKDFPADVKAIVSDALNGTYPAKPAGLDEPAKAA